MSSPVIDYDSIWKQQLPFITTLLGSGPDSLLKQLPEPSEAFNLDAQPRRRLCCIDGGIPFPSVRLAGSGVGVDVPTLSYYVKNAGIEEFTTHDDCGAFRKSFPTVSNVGTAIKEWGERTAAELRLAYRHITTAEMVRPDFHPETAIFYDGTGKFHTIKGLPYGFVLSRRYFPMAFQDLTLAAEIAFGSSGFGKRFTAETPLHVIVIPHPNKAEFSAEVLMEEVRDALSRYGQHRIRVVAMSPQFD